MFIAGRLARLVEVEVKVSVIFNTGPREGTDNDSAQKGGLSD